MENTTALLWRQEEVLSERHVFVVEADDAALHNLQARSLVVHSDLATIAAQQYSAWPQVPAQADLIVVVLPKARQRLELLLTALASSIASPVELWLVGPGQGGIKGALKQLKNYTTDGHVENIDNARHCRLYSIMLAPQKPATLADFAQQWVGEGNKHISYPGVFSHGRLDDGTALLLSVLPADFTGQQVLDMGCGAGVLSLALAQRGAQVVASDVSVTAVAATEATLALHEVAASVQGADLYGDLKQRFDVICTKPPFHEGIKRTTVTTETLIQQAPQYLTAAGELWMVANHGLPYEELLRQHFEHVETLAANNRFVVWRAITPRV